MRALIVVAHPDDEVLGCGATAALLSRRGSLVRACILSGRVDARQSRPAEEALFKHICEAQGALGIGEPILGDFPNIRFNTVAHLDLVRFIEAAMVSTQATVLFTHHPADVNDDHRLVSLACQAAARLHQRNASVPSLEALFYMEIPSSTDWAFPSNVLPFVPNAFLEVGLELVERKIAALSKYEGVMRPYPHPRSAAALRSLAAFRGGQAGLDHAEAFQIAYKNLMSWCDLPDV